MRRPDFRIINEFRRRHLEALAELFVQVLRLCRQAGLVKLGHVALDGTKLQANASKHKAISYGRMARAEAELAAAVAGWLERPEREDAADDAAFGPDQRGDELPTGSRTSSSASSASARRRRPSGRRPRWHRPQTPSPARPRVWRTAAGRGTPPDRGPPARAQRNFTDPDSRVLKARDGFVQGYNGRASDCYRVRAGPGGGRVLWRGRRTRAAFSGPQFIAPP
jgi:hypothetical protein